MTKRVVFYFRIIDHESWVRIPPRHAAAILIGMADNPASFSRCKIAARMEPIETVLCAPPSNGPRRPTPFLPPGK